jgi:histidinol-phosphate aminotransferase
MFSVDILTRNNIKKLVPYSSARDEFSGTAAVFLDANENSLGSPLPTAYNRYPDPHQRKLKEALGRIKGVPPPNIFLGNGSDECIDILYRAFCNPGKDNVIINPPTYGMYEVSAHINDIEVRTVNLRPDFQLDLEAIEKTIDANTRIIWICSPNNPTGNAIHPEDIEIILNNFDGLVVIDEAYINFSKYKTFTGSLKDYPNLVVLQTLSKAWGMAGLRLGMAFASEEIIAVYDKIKPPYNISQATQQLVLEALSNIAEVNETTRLIVGMRTALREKLRQISFVKEVYPSEANFLLAKTDDAKQVYEFLLQQGIVVRDRSRIQHCEGCLRITVGTEEENNQLIHALRQFKK